MSPREVARRLGGIASGNKVLAPGPGHGPDDRSLSITIDESAPDGFIVNSFANDNWQAGKDYVRDTVGMDAWKPGDREPAVKPRARTAPPKVFSDAALVREGFHHAATYDYTSPDGEVLFQVLRYEHPTKAKTFLQRQPNGKGGWHFGRGDPVLYRWHEVADASDQPVHFCEGEKDADRLAGLGLVATTVPNGAWSESATDALAGRVVYVLEDNDDAGRTKSKKTEERLSGVAASVHVVRLPGLPERGDVSDWLNAGGAPEELARLCEATPAWKPPPTAANDNKAGQQARAALPFRLEMYSDIDPMVRKEWLVRDFLGKGEFSVWYGRPGAGKSAIVGDLACHVAAGWDWFGRKVQGGPVLYIAAERAAVVKRRFAAFRKTHDGKADDLPLGIVSGYIDLCSSMSHATALIEMIREFEARVGAPTALVVVDTVSRTLAGGDENGPKEMGSFVAKTGLIQSETLAHILAVHHPPIEGPPRLRGHGSLLGALDTTVLVRRNARDRTAIVEKQNDGEEGEHVVFDLTSVTLFEDEDGPTTAPVVTACGGNLAGQYQDVEPARPQPKGVAAAVLKSLRKALEQVGESPPPGSVGFPDGILAVTRETWRGRYYDDAHAEHAADEETVRKRFTRATKELVRLEVVGELGDWAWIKDSGT